MIICLWIERRKKNSIYITTRASNLSKIIMWLRKAAEIKKYLRYLWNFMHFTLDMEISFSISFFSCSLYHIPFYACISRHFFMPFILLFTIKYMLPYNNRGVWNTTNVYRIYGFRVIFISSSFFWDVKANTPRGLI